MAEKVVTLYAEKQSRPARASSSLTTIIFRQVRKNRLAIVGSVILLLLALIAIFAPIITPYDPYETNYANVKKPPSADHLLGDGQGLPPGVVERGAGPMLATLAADFPTLDDERYAAGHRPADDNRHAAQQSEAGRLLDREITGAVERRPDELGS